MTNKSDAENAIAELQGHGFDGYNLNVEVRLLLYLQQPIVWVVCLSVLAN